VAQRPAAVYPSVFSRLASLAYEALIVAALLVAGGFAFFGASAAFQALGSGPQPGASHVERTLLQVFLATLLGAYFVRSWVRGGQTLAMKAWKLRLVRPDGRGIAPRVGLARFLIAGIIFGAGTAAALWLWRHPGSMVGWLATVPAAVDLGWLFFDRERQFLHDRLAGTRVVRVSRAG
jgi:uncharacterized RDD family membrane protein YckC